jgi:hypothetical protein
MMKPKFLRPLFCLPLCFGLLTLPVTHADEENTETSEAEANENASETEAAPDLELSELTRERSRLESLNAIAAAKLQSELAELREEKARIEAELELAAAQRNKERNERQDAIELIKLEMEELARDAALEAAKLKQSLQEELTKLQIAKDRTELESAIIVSEATAAIQQANASEVQMQHLLLELRT